VNVPGFGALGDDGRTTAQIHRTTEWRGTGMYASIELLDITDVNG
jgi:hypothetical protein